MDGMRTLNKTGNGSAQRSATTMKHGRGTSGFSLLELMLVVAIMGTLMAVVAFNFVGAGDRAKKRATEATLKTVQTSLDGYYAETSSWPTDLQVLVTTKYLKDMKLVDGWGTPILYEGRMVVDGQPYTLGSAGPNKLAGDNDDINAWMLNK